jgi:ABC-2 type transport system ATP-binding protein
MQYVGESAYCDLVGVMAQGQLLLVDTPEGLRRRAFGGDVIHMRTQGPFNYSMQHEIQDLPFITGQVRQVGERDVQMIVEEANTAIPRLMEWARGHQLEIESIGEDQPPFDDVFVKLVKQEEEQINA